MKKRIFCLALAVMLLACSAAFADVPGKTTQDTTKVSFTEIYNVSIDPDRNFAIGPSVKAEDAQSILDEINAFAQSDSVVNFFGAEIAAQLSEATKTAVEDIDMPEFFPIYVANYKSEYGLVYVSFNPRTDFSQTGPVSCVIGVIGTDGVEWSAQEAYKSPWESGTVTVVFPEELLEQISGANGAVLAIVNGPRK